MFFAFFIREFKTYPNHFGTLTEIERKQLRKDVNNLFPQLKPGTEDDSEQTEVDRGHHLLDQPRRGSLQISTIFLSRCWRCQCKLETFQNLKNV